MPFQKDGWAQRCPDRCLRSSASSWKSFSWQKTTTNGRKSYNCNCSSVWCDNGMEGRKAKLFWRGLLRHCALHILHHRCARIISWHPALGNSDWNLTQDSPAAPLPSQLPPTTFVICRNWKMQGLKKLTAAWAAKFCSLASSVRRLNEDGRIITMASNDDVVCQQIPL
jgi:hypothetical protein